MPSGSRGEEKGQPCLQMGSRRDKAPRLCGPESAPPLPPLRQGDSSCKLGPVQLLAKCPAHGVNLPSAPTFEPGRQDPPIPKVTTQGLW